MDKAEPKPERTDEEQIRYEIALVGPVAYRIIAAGYRRAYERTDPELYRKLSKTRPLLFGPDTPARLRLEYPELYPPAKPKP